MEALLKRLSFALLCGFGTFFVLLPVSCGALLLYSQHVWGDVDAGGPHSMLGGMAIAAIAAVLVIVLVMLKTAPRRR